MALTGLINMKPFLLINLCCFISLMCLNAQDSQSNEERKKIHYLIDQYAEARLNKDAELLKSILTSDVDQLVSTGEWRRGFDSSLEGMMRSSSSNPGSRTLTVEYLKFLSEESAMVDCRYQIKNSDGSLRKMWSSFAVVYVQDRWKISSIRNMLPRK